ncbi:MAG TPA: hydrolase [Oculatellaceae cyanobacterium]
MRHFNLLKKEHAILVVVDVQEKFRQHIAQFEQMVKNIVRLIEACKILEIPVIVTEQYPKGLGATVLEIHRAVEGKSTFEKTAFSCCGSDEFTESLRIAGRNQIMVCGIEAHVCVNQTVHDLLARNYSVHIVEDAISSRDLNNKDVALRKMLHSGAIPSCTEMALLELVEDANAPSFKGVQTLIR